MSATMLPASLPGVSPSSKDATSALWLPAFSLWWREIVRFYRQRMRVIGTILSPLIFWFILGSGFGNSVHQAGVAPRNFLASFFPGSLTMIVLFTSIFSMMSLIQDRNEGFLLSVMAAPINRAAIVLGKVLGGATLAALQGLLFLVFAPMVGIHLGIVQLGLVAVTVFLIAFMLTALGFVIAWPMDSSQAFHAIVNVVLIPIWMLSGALFPLASASAWLRAIMRVNPLTYGQKALLVLLLPSPQPDAGASGAAAALEPLAILLLFCAAVFAAAFIVVNRRTTKPAA